MLLRPFFEMVRQEGVEPPHLSAPEPKSGVSTNSTTGAVGGYSSRLSANYQPPANRLTALQNTVKRLQILIDFADPALQGVQPGIIRLCCGLRCGLCHRLRPGPAIQ